MSEQTIYITGAGSGIGQEVARRYAKQGAHLALFDLKFSDSAKANVLGEMQSKAQNIGFYEADVTQFETLQGTINEAAEEIGLPDLALHCAGIQNAGTFAGYSRQDFEKVVSVNLFGSRNFAEACLPLLQQNTGRGGNKGKLVFVASLAGLVGNYGYAAYCASKFAVVGLAQTLRMELKPEGITVQVICPPEVDTPMVHDEHKTIHPVTKKLKYMAGALTLDQAVNDIVKGLRSNRFYIIPGRLARLTYWLSKLLPTSLSNLLADDMIKKELSRMART